MSATTITWKYCITDKENSDGMVLGELVRKVFFFRRKIVAKKIRGMIASAFTIVLRYKVSIVTICHNPKSRLFTILISRLWVHWHWLSIPLWSFGFINDSTYSLKCSVLMKYHDDPIKKGSFCTKERNRVTTRKYNSQTILCLPLIKGKIITFTNLLNNKITIRQNVQNKSFSH